MKYIAQRTEFWMRDMLEHLYMHVWTLSPLSCVLTGIHVYISNLYIMYMTLIVAITVPSPTPCRRVSFAALPSYEADRSLSIPSVTLSLFRELTNVTPFLTYPSRVIIAFLSMIMLSVWISLSTLAANEPDSVGFVLKCLQYCIPEIPEHKCL